MLWHEFCKSTLFSQENHSFHFNYIQTHSYTNMNSDHFVLIHKFLYIEFIFLFTVFSLIICLISLFTYTFMNQFTWFHYNALHCILNTMKCILNTMKWNVMHLKYNAMKCKVMFEEIKPIDYVFNQIYDKTNGLSLAFANSSTVERISYVNTKSTLIKVLI